MLYGSMTFSPNMSAFEDEFSSRLRAEFDPPEDVVQDIVQMAMRYQNDRGIQKSVDHWIDWMNHQDYDSVISRWNYAIGMTATEYWDIGEEDSEENPYKL